MSKILIWRKPVPGSDIDIFGKTDYKTIYKNTIDLYGKNGGVNWGNKVWYQGICSEIDTPENQLTYGTDESIEEINANYDLIVYPMANFFSERYCKDTSKLVKTFSQIKIPVYIIACGAQADSYDALDDLISSIGDSAKRFIDAIYATGGEFALRGFFTKEFFDLLGYPSAVVTGCPSLFQVGPDLKVDKQVRDEPKTVFNGHIKSYERLLKELSNSCFIAQDEFLDCLYDSDYFRTSNLKKDVLFTYYHSIYQAELLGEGRVKLFADTYDWLYFLKENRFEYSFGTKIHGSIMPILTKIPATVVFIDSRTREIAEYFDIPTIPFKRGYQYMPEDLMSAYKQADYSLFNKNFKMRYLQYESFLQRHKIVSRINTDNKFFFRVNNNYKEVISSNTEE